MSKTRIIERSFAAGILIGIAGIAFLQVGGIYGSILFSLGLLIIITQNLLLFTGKIGYVDSLNDLLKLCCIVLPINLLGAAFVGSLYQYAYGTESAFEIILNKVSLDYSSILIRGFFCGMMMICAVESTKKNQILGLIFSVSLFVLCGFEHCVADMFYVVASLTFSAETAILVVVATIGNALGSLFLYNLLKSGRKEVK